MKSKKVLIIGGGGFLGHCLIEELRKDSFEPYIFDIQGGKRDDGITVISGDRHNYHDLAAAREYDFDCVVDLIAYRPKETELAIKVFSGYTGRFVHISTFSAYQAPEISPFDESHPLTADGSNTYMNRKADCERLLEEAGRTSGFPFVVVRSAPVFGPHDNVSRENYYLKRMKTGQPIIVPGDAKTPLLTVFVRDLIKTVALAVSNEAAIGKAFHAAQREMVSLQTHIMEIGRLSGLTPEILPVNEQLLAAAGFNLSAFPYYSGNALYADTSAVRDVLGLEQTTYKEAMKETMSWLLANDPLNQPSWPGRITMQARMAATNDTIQYLKEKTFVAQYKKLFSSFRRQIQSDRAKYEFDNHDSITDIFLSFTGSAPASTEQKSTALLVHEDCFSALMDSQLADQLDVATTAICRAPDSFFSNIESMEDMLHTDAPLREEDGQKNEPAQDEQCPITVKAECDYASKKAFNTFAFLEQFQYRGDGLGRYYFYTSTPGYNYCHYSHDYLFHVLNLFEKNDTPKNGQIYPSEIDILPIGEVFPKSVEKEILSMEGRKSIRLHLGDALNKYYSRACRLIPGACSARCGNKFIVPKNGTVKACFHGQQIGTTCNTAAEMRQKIASVVEDVEKSRGCAQCPAFEYCPRCLYLADHESYCRLLKRHPHTFRIFSLYDFLRRLENYEIDLAKDSQITIKISVAANRCLLPSLEAPLVKSDQPTYRVNKHLLPAVVENKCYVYNVSDGTIIKLTAIAFLVLEVVEAYRIDPLSIAGCRFSYNDTGMLTKEQIIKATNTLVKNQLITVSSKEI